MGWGRVLKRSNDMVYLVTKIVTTHVSMALAPMAAAAVAPEHSLGARTFLLGGAGLVYLLIL